jgi:HEAT repeat protein/beta-lactamase regulating signal transducer with metallopeptidase domain
MSLISELASWTSATIPWLQVADAVGKASILLGAAGVASVVLKRASASIRHLIWTLALVGSLVVPALSMALPRWSVPVVTIPAVAQVAPEAAPETTPTAPHHRIREAATAPQAAPTAAATEPSVAAGVMPSRSIRQLLDGVRWETVAIGLWLAGFALIMARLLIGMIAVQWMSRRTEVVVDASWLPLARRVAADLSLSARVTFLRSPRATMPMAWGIVRPAVLMPADADGWPAERLRIVLLHELAHVRRRDCLTHLLAQATCAVYWFHPLAWMAAKRARAERERACDDLVLAAGTRGSDYAEELLQIARVMRSGRFPVVLAGATLAMAHRSQLEGRLLAILDPRIPRSGLTRVRALATSVACMLAIMPLAAIQPWTSEAPPQKVNAAVPDPSILRPPNVPPLETPSGERAPVPAARPQAESSETPAADDRDRQSNSLRKVEDATQGVAGGVSGGVARGVRDGVASGVAGGVASGVAGGIAGGVAGNIRTALDLTLTGLELSDEQGSPTPTPTPMPTPTPTPTPHPNVNVDSKGGQNRHADPRTIAALTTALKDTDKDVRETAMHALVQMRDPSILDPLVEALRDTSADVREQAAHGLGQLRDRRAVDPLIGAIKDTNGSVREQVVFALGQLRDPRAIDGLTAALKDTAPNVREQAAFALGQIRDRRATTALAAAITDTNDDVRQQAVFALGQLRDPSSIDGLITALHDTKPNVREQAAFALGQIRDRKAVGGLIGALKDTNGDVRQQAAFALGQIRDPSAVEALVIALKDSDADVREQAAFALGQLRDPRAIDGLTAALKDASATVRQQAAFALGQLAR